MWTTMRRRLDEDDGTHEFHALNTLLLVVVLGLCLLSAYLIKKYRFYFMPESSAALCVGLVVGGIARLITHSDEELDFLSFSPELFFFLLLPPIIFEAGYTLRRKNFFRNLGTITMYAVVGTLISTFVVGYFTYACARAGIVDVDATNPMEALLFGALISAVDPVATLSIMGSPELNCDPLLYSLVFGESVLNDAVAIVLFRTFYNYYEEGAELDQSKIPVALFEFLFVTIGSILMGVATGLICSYLFRHTRIRDYPKYEISLLFLFAYGAYALAESIELSGIMALFFCGIVLAHYNSYNLSKTSQTTAEEIFAALSTVAESFVFMYMGMGCFPCGHQASSALQFLVCRGVRAVFLSQYGRGYLSEIVSEFEPKPGQLCRDSETRPLSLSEKWGTRRVDGVEGSTTLSDAVDAKTTHWLISTQASSRAGSRRGTTPSSSWPSSFACWDGS